MPDVSNIVKSIQDIMRKDAGTYGDAQRLEQLGWLGPIGKPEPVSIVKTEPVGGQRERARRRSRTSLDLGTRVFCAEVSAVSACGVR